jgi:ketose-bisphosphate aldolase
MRVSKSGDNIACGTEAAVLRQALRQRREPIFAVNVNDQYDLRAAVDAADEAEVPLIIMVSVRAIEYTGLDTIVALFLAARERSAAPIWLELDHATDVSLIEECIARGFDLVMADYSAAPFTENVSKTRDVVTIAHAANVLVEGEVNAIPPGVDADLRTGCSSPREARDFALQTGVDFLAVSVGNVHGFDRLKPTLDLDLIRRIAETVPVPLVLHGADYSNSDDIAQAVSAGITKINIGPELREAYCLGLRAGLERCNWAAPDHRLVLNDARHAVRHALLRRISDLIPKSV